MQKLDKSRQKHDITVNSKSDTVSGLIPSKSKLSSNLPQTISSSSKSKLGDKSKGVVEIKDDSSALHSLNKNSEIKFSDVKNVVKSKE